MKKSGIDGCAERGLTRMAYGGKVEMKKGGSVKKSKKANMQKIATKAVKAHERRMHKGQM